MEWEWEQEEEGGRELIVSQAAQTVMKQSKSASTLASGHAGSHRKLVLIFIPIQTSGNTWKSVSAETRFTAAHQQHSICAGKFRAESGLEVLWL